MLFFIKNDVCRLDAAMNDTTAMREGQSLADMEDDL